MRKFSRTPAYIGGPTNRGAPGYGEDNEWLLTSMLGMSTSDVEKLAEEGVDSEQETSRGGWLSTRSYSVRWPGRAGP